MHSASQIHIHSSGQIIAQPSSYVSQTANSINRKIMIICQGGLPFIIGSLPEISLENISIVTSHYDTPNLASKRFNSVDTVADYFSSGEVEQIAFSRLKETTFDRIIATSETDILRAAQMRDIFHLTGQSYESALAFRDKIIMKTLLRRNGIAVPDFKLVKSASDVLRFVENRPYPFIIKPTRGYGSVKTRVLKSAADIQQLLSAKGVFDEFHQSNLDLEEFVHDAEMYHIDGLIRDGQVIVIWPSKCINTCIEMIEGKPTGGFLLEENNPLVDVLNRFALDVLKSLPTPSDTGFHLEVFYKDHKPIFCEIASRIGGPWINDLWVHGMNFNLKKEFIRAQGLLPVQEVVSKPGPKKIIGGIIFPPKHGRVTAIPTVCDCPGILAYNSLVVIGQDLQDPENMLEVVATATLIANSEAMIQKTIATISTWFSERFATDRDHNS